MKKILLLVTLLVVGILFLNSFVLAGPIDNKEIFNNSPPKAPDIEGPQSVKPGTHEYTFKVIDPDGDNISYEIIWGDDQWEETGWYSSGEEVILNHAYHRYGSVVIKARAKDIHGAFGEWGYILIEISKNSQQSSLNNNNVERTDVFNQPNQIIANRPPDEPRIYGPTRLRVGENYTFEVLSKDPDKDNVSYYIKWGDGTSYGWTSYYVSGVGMKIGHIWTEMDSKNIVRCKAKDTYNAESDWGSLPIKVSQSSQESEIQSEELVTYLAKYGLETRDAIKDFEQTLYRWIYRGRWMNPFLSYRLKKDIDELSDILYEMGIYDDMTIAEALPIIEENKKSFQDKGMNLFCSIYINCYGGGSRPLFRPYKVLFGAWEFGWDGYVNINSSVLGLQYCESVKCYSMSGRYIGMIGEVSYNFLTFFTVPEYWIEGSFVLYSKCDVPFVTSVNDFSQNPCPYEEQIMDENLGVNKVHEGVCGCVK